MKAYKIFNEQQQGQKKKEKTLTQFEPTSKDVYMNWTKKDNQLWKPDIREGAQLVQVLQTGYLFGGKGKDMYN